MRCGILFTPVKRVPPASPANAPVFAMLDQQDY
jgi:hypothetical protein